MVIIKRVVWTWCCHISLGGGAITCIDKVIRSCTYFITIASLLERELCQIYNNILVVS